MAALGMQIFRLMNYWVLELDGEVHLVNDKILAYLHVGYHKLFINYRVKIRNLMDYKPFMCHLHQVIRTINNKGWEQTK